MPATRIPVLIACQISCLRLGLKQRLHLLQLGQLAGGQFVQFGRILFHDVELPDLLACPVLGRWRMGIGAKQIPEVRAIAEAGLPAVVINDSGTVEEVVLRRTA